MIDPTDGPGPTGGGGRERAGEGGEGHPGEEPVGTLFLLMVYVMVLAGMWGTMYWFLLTR